MEASSTASWPAAVSRGLADCPAVAEARRCVSPEPGPRVALVGLGERGGWRRFEATHAYLNIGSYASLLVSLNRVLAAEARSLARDWPRGLPIPHGISTRMPEGVLPEVYARRGVLGNRGGQSVGPECGAPSAASPWRVLAMAPRPGTKSGTGSRWSCIEGGCSTGPEQGVPPTLPKRVRCD